MAIDTISKSMGFGKLLFDQANFTADGETGTTVDIGDYTSNAGLGTSVVPQYANLYLTSSHATAVTDIVSFFLQASVDGNTWTNLCEVTDADLPNSGGTSSYSAVVSATAFPTIGYRYFRFNCTTVGAGNTLHGYAELWC